MNKMRKGLSVFGNPFVGSFSFRKKKEEEKVNEGPKREAEEKIETPSHMVARKFFHNPMGVVGLIGFLFIFLAVTIGQAVIPFDPYFSDGAMKNIPPKFGYMNISSSLLKEGIKDVQSGVTFSMGLSEEGNFAVWGLDADDKLINVPEKVKKQIDGHKIEQIAVGDRHVLVLTDEGKIYGWGDNSFSQTQLPGDIQALCAKEGVEKIGAGDQYSVVLTKKGNIRVWGSTLPNHMNSVPKKLKDNVADFRTGSVNILIYTRDKHFEVFGAKGTELDTAMPEEMQKGPVEVRDFARTQRSAVVVKEDGQLVSWGSASEGGHSAPKLEEGLVDVAAGRAHFVGVTESGKIYAWGQNSYDVTECPTGDGYQRIFVGYYNNYAFKNPNKYDAWGLNGYMMGTDELGRDLFVRLIHGGAVTLKISFVSIIIQIIIGILIGMISGFYGGWVDNVLQRFSEIISSFPFYPLIITLAATIPPDTDQYTRIMMVMVILGILSWTGISRMVRGQILAEREKDYITAAKALGLSESRIMFSHMFPNILSIVIVEATLGYAGNLLSEAGLSFLGFGVIEPYPSWGNMMSSAQSVDVIEKYWWRWIFPGLAVFFTAFTVNLIGDALRDALDPKTLEG